MAANRAIRRIVSAVSGCVLAAVAVVVAAGTASASDDAVPLVSGRWGEAVEVPGTTTLNAGGAGQVSTVSWHQRDDADQPRLACSVWKAWGTVSATEPH